MLPPRHTITDAHAPKATRCPSRHNYEAVTPDYSRGWHIYEGETESTERATLPVRKG
jgi:hypothetical protein